MKFNRLAALLTLLGAAIPAAAQPVSTATAVPSSTAVPTRTYKIDCARVTMTTAKPTDRPELLRDLECYQAVIAAAAPAANKRVEVLKAFEAATPPPPPPPAPTPVEPKPPEPVPDDTPLPEPSKPVDTAPPPPAGDVLITWTDDANRDNYNDALRLAWERENGDWIDADGVRFGARAFATGVPVANSVLTIDSPIADMRLSFSGTAPHVSAITCNGAAPLAIARATSSTGSSWSRKWPITQGVIYVRCGAPGPLLVSIGKTFASKGVLSIFRPDPRPRTLSFEGLPAAEGTAADIALDLRADGWRKASGKAIDATARVEPDGTLLATMPVGGAVAISDFFLIPAEGRAETMFARFVLRAEADWRPTMGGKWPGLANTGHGVDSSGIAGWGGRQANGVRWSARLNRAPYVPGTAFDTDRGWGTYAYRVNRRTMNGDVEWSVKPFPVGRFFVLDQMVKLNSVVDGVAQADGEIAYWLDGELVNRFTGIVWRTRLGDDTLPESVWMDVYEGGVGYRALHPHSVTFAEIIVSRKRLPFDRAALARLNGRAD